MVVQVGLSTATWGPGFPRLCPLRDTVSRVALAIAIQLADGEGRKGTPARAGPPPTGHIELQEVWEM